MVLTGRSLVCEAALGLVTLSYRPGYTHPLGERTYYSRLALGTLPSEESSAMAERGLDVVTLPHELQQLITSKAEGNPLYIEGVTKSLVESGVSRKTNEAYALERPAEQVSVPDTLQDVILSRIDRLERRAKEAIQLASVTGRDFTVRLLLHGMHKLLLFLQEMSKPVIAAINGTAMGGGCELALACDFRYIARGGILGLPEVRVGILPGAGGTQRMTRLLGTAKALELMLLGQVVSAGDAERIGLVHKAVEPDQLLPQALALANELASRPPLSIALIKHCVLKGSELPLEDALKLEQEAFMQTMRSDDASRLMREYQAGDTPLNES